MFVHAGWCITCRGKSRFSSSSPRIPRLPTLVVLVVDDDKDKATRRELNVTLIAAR